MYINILNLLWICPLCTFIGIFLAALVSAGPRDDRP